MLKIYLVLFVRTKTKNKTISDLGCVQTLTINLTKVVTFNVFMACYGRVYCLISVLSSVFLAPSGLTSYIRDILKLVVKL